MADIAMCFNDKCLMKDRCYRQIAPVNPAPMQQNMMKFNPQLVEMNPNGALSMSKFTCDGYIRIDR